MSVIGLAVMNPATVAAMIDSQKWEVALLSSTPHAKKAYATFVKKRMELADEEDFKHKPAVQIIIGINNLKLANLENVFWSTILVDSTVNLVRVRQQKEELTIMDVKEIAHGHYIPTPITPKMLNKEILKKGTLGSLPKFIADNTFASIVEIRQTTNKISLGLDAYDQPDDGMVAMINELMQLCGDNWVKGTDQYFVQYLFHTCTRGFISSRVTRKIKDKKTKELWKEMCDYADSNVGYAMYSAFYKLCTTEDQDYSPQDAIPDFGLENYARDFMYALSVMPVSGGYDFLTELGNFTRERE